MKLDKTKDFSVMGDHVEVIEVEAKPEHKYKSHYLNDRNNKIWCPLNRSYLCTNACAWFDNVDEQCLHMTFMFDLKVEIGNLTDTIADIITNKDFTRTHYYDTE